MKPSGEAYAAIRASAPWHPKFLSIPAAKRIAAFGFWTAVLVLCQTYRNDGRIPRAQLVAAFSCSEEQREVLVELLVNAGLFDEDGDDILVHDYLEWNRSKADIEAGKQAMSAGGRKGGKQSGESRRRVALKPTFQASPEKSGEERAEKETSRAGEGSCPQCGGAGAVGGEVCGWCGGSGRS